jgi:hypothetical protein
VKLLADTSVAVPLVLASHDAHALVDRFIGDRPVHLAGHAAFETYAVLTRLPGDARLLPADALTLVRTRFAGVVAPTDPPDRLIARLVEGRVAGGATCDGLIAAAALAGDGSILLSRDVRAAGTYARLGANVELVNG